MKNIKFQYRKYVCRNIQEVNYVIDNYGLFYNSIDYKDIENIVKNGFIILKEYGTGYMPKYCTKPCIECKYNYSCEHSIITTIDITKIMREEKLKRILYG